MGNVGYRAGYACLKEKMNGKFLYFLFNLAVNLHTSL